MPQYVHERFRALIVDDDAVSREFLLEYLSPLADCEIADKGAKAMELFGSAIDDDPFQLICLDTYLPDISGREVLRQMRELESSHGVPKEDSAVIIMTTAASEIKDVLKAMNSGCDGYVKKPFTKEQLYVELNRIGLEFAWQP